MKERYYYKKNGKAVYSLKEPLSNILSDTTGYVEITEEEFNALLPTPYQPTAAELARKEKREQISQLKSELAATDYQCLKYAEGWISEEDYAPIKAARQALRDQINELESEL